MTEWAGRRSRERKEQREEEKVGVVTEVSTVAGHRQNVVFSS